MMTESVCTSTVVFKFHWGQIKWVWSILIDGNIKPYTALASLPQVAMRCGVPATQVKNVIIWGNHSSTQYPDVHHCKVIYQCYVIMKYYYTTARH